MHIEKKIRFYFNMWNGFKDIEIDFGVIDENGNINGLIGLDVLLELGVYRFKI